MRMPGKKPEAGPTWEAMAETLTMIGEPYQINDILLPPGEWVEVSKKQADRLVHYSWAIVREKVAAND